MREKAATWVCDLKPTSCYNKGSIGWIKKTRRKRRSAKKKDNRVRTAYRKDMTEPQNAERRAKYCGKQLPSALEKRRADELNKAMKRSRKDSRHIEKMVPSDTEDSCCCCCCSGTEKPGISTAQLKLKLRYHQQSHQQRKPKDENVVLHCRCYHYHHHHTVCHDTA